MSCKKLSLIVLAASGLAACETVDPQTQSLDPKFGEAVAWNKEVQVINPDPTYPADAEQPGASGAKAAEASKRYRKDQVKPVETVGTTSGSGTGSGSSSGPR